MTEPWSTRPSWCYGTPGIARAVQLAAIAVGDVDRQRSAEQAIAACLTDPQPLTEPGLCHGLAGLYQTAFRAAADATSPAIAAQLPPLTDRLTRAATRHTTERHRGRRVDQASPVPRILAAVCRFDRLASVFVL